MVNRSRALVAAVVVLAVAISALGASASTTKAQAEVKPTVVLVHGAFADASGWSDVIGRLQAKGYPVVATANPLRGVSSDVAYLKSVLATISGPIVLVGHSYGGFVITNAATGNPNLKALVYVAAFAPDEGDTVASLGEKVPGGMIGPPTLDLHPYPGPNGETAFEGTIKTSVFREVFAADLSKAKAAVMAVSQRPASLATLGEPSGVPAWKTIPSWYVVAGSDNAIGTELERFMAERMNAKTTEIDGASHVVMISRPQKVADVILDAATSTP